MKKRIFRLFACLLAAALLAGSSLAAEDTPVSGDYTLTVNGQIQDVSGLPCAAYLVGDTVMVPLRIVAEALGYEVAWFAATRQITVDGPIQQALVQLDGELAQFSGKLKIINLDWEESMAQPVTLVGGFAYVPISFFEVFFNEVSVTDSAISISPQMAELA